MKIQFAQTFKTRTGEAYTEPGSPASITLGDICIGVLDVTYNDEGNEGLKPKLRRAELGDRVAEAVKTMTPLEMLDADREMLKERIGKRNLPPHLTSLAVKALDTGVPAE